MCQKKKILNRSSKTKNQNLLFDIELVKELRNLIERKLINNFCVGNALIFTKNFSNRPYRSRRFIISITRM